MKKNRLIDINALLWLAAFGSAISDSSYEARVFIATLGLLIGAIVQHCVAKANRTGQPKHGEDQRAK